MHKSRHTAGQRVLDATGNLKAVQKLLGHASIQTTGDIYADWDINQLAATMADVLADDETADSQSLPRPRRKNQRFCSGNEEPMETAGIEPAQRSRRGGSDQPRLTRSAGNSSASTSKSPS